MSQQLKIGCLTPAALIGMCHPAAILLLLAPSGLPGGPVQSGSPGEVWHGSSGEQPRYPFISKSKSGPCELFIQSFCQQPLSPCAVLAVTQTQGSGLGERHMNNYHVIRLGLWGV